jgi:predicted ArsR family transcriptional regulator
MIVEGITISEMAEKLGIPKHTVETRLSRAGIEPVFYGSLYAPDTLDKIRDAKRGRPKKPGG